MLGAKEVEQYYPNPEKAEVKDLPMDNSIVNAVRTLRRERGDENGGSRFSRERFSRTVQERSREMVMESKW